MRNKSCQVLKRLINLSNKKRKCKSIRFHQALLIIIIGAFIIITTSYLCSESRVGSIRYSGGLLQLIGFGVVAIGLFCIYQNYSDNPITLRKLWLQIKKMFGDKAERKAGGVDSVVVATAMGEGVVTTKKNTVEERLDYLETEIIRIEKEYKKSISNFREDFNKSTAELKNKINELNKEIQETKRMIRDFAVGGLNIELIGVGWFVLGVYLSTWYIQVADYRIINVIFNTIDRIAIWFVGG